MDPLSELLSLLKPKSYLSGGFDIGVDVAIQWPHHRGVKCYAVISGQGWLSVQGVPDAVVLHAGDCFLLPRGLPFSLSTNPAREPVDFSTLRGGWLADSAAANKHEVGCYLAGGHFALTGGPVGILCSTLPPIVHIRKDSDKAVMRWSLERMQEELRNPQPGGSLIAQQLACVMLIQALRLHLADGAAANGGWLSALADKQMCQAITCMHDAPGRAWTLQNLAESAGMSRSVFAQRFKDTVGISPMDYLLQWRMLLAGDRLKNSTGSLSEIAASLGYESESAFGKAFKRVMGCSPGRYGRQAEPPS